MSGNPYGFGLTFVWAGVGQYMDIKVQKEPTDFIFKWNHVALLLGVQSMCLQWSKHLEDMLYPDTARILKNGTG